jgi:hypothetical protein
MIDGYIKNIGEVFHFPTKIVDDQWLDQQNWQTFWFDQSKLVRCLVHIREFVSG